MSKKYHISPTSNKPEICHAEIKCRLGGEHFETKEEAERHLDKENKKAVIQERIEVPKGFDRVRRTVVGYKEKGVNSSYRKSI